MKVDVIYVFILIIIFTFIIIGILNQRKKVQVVKEIIQETPAPYWYYNFPNYWERSGRIDSQLVYPTGSIWERAPRDNRFYDPYFSYPYGIGPWWYGGSGSGYSGGIRTGGGGHRGGGGHGGGGHH